MNPSLSFWSSLTGLLATEATLVVAIAWLAARWLRSPQIQRAVWQAALLGIALLWVAELAGARGQLARWLPAERPRRTLSVRVLDAPRIEPVPETITKSITEPFLVGPTEAPLPTVTPPRPVWWPGWLWLAGLTLLTGRLALSRAWLMGCVWRSRGRDHRVGGRVSVLECVRLAAAFVRRTCARTSTSPVRSQKAEAPLRSATALQDADAGSPAPDDTGAMVARLRRPLGLRRVRLLVWPRLRGPVAFGVLRPTVALPEDFRTRFSPAQCEAMLAHELAHLAARDPLWLTLADLVCALAWWHPAVWWARRQLRSACESAADEAAALVPDGRAALAESLVTFGRELASPRWARGIGVAGDGLKSQLARRVKVLLHASGGWCAVRPARTYATRLGATGVVAALVLAPWPGINGAGLAPLLAAVKAAEPPTPPVATATNIPGPWTPSDLIEFERVAPPPFDMSALERIVLPTFELKGEKLITLVQRLEAAARAADPAGRGVNFSFSPGEPVDQHKDGATGIGAVTIKSASPMRHVKLSEVIHAITSHAELPVGVAYHPEGVVFVASSGEATTARLSMNGVLKFRFDLATKEFLGHLVQFLPQGRTDSKSIHMAVREFCMTNGVDFQSRSDGTGSSEQEQKAVFFNQRTGALFLRATPEEIDRINRALKELNLLRAFLPPDAAHPRSSGNDLGTREFRLAVVGLDQTFRNHLLYFLPTGETDLKRHLRSAVRSFLYVNGVELPSATVINPLSANANGPTATPAQEQKSAFFNNDTGVLFVRATMADIDRVERAIQSLGLLTATDHTSTPSGAPDGKEKTSKPERADTAGLLRRYESALRAAKQADLDAAPIFAAQGKDSAQAAQATERYRKAKKRVQLFEQVIAADKELESLRTRYKDGHPKVKEASARRTELLARIETSAADTTSPTAPTKAAIAPTNIEFEVQFAEINERGSDDLGLDWLFGQSPTNNPALQSGPATNLLTEAGSPSGQNLRVDLLRTEGQSATLTEAQFVALRKRLEDRAGVEFLTTPKLITQAGRQARIAVSDMRNIVSGVAGATQGSTTNQAAIMYQTEQIATGPSVDLVATVEGGTTRLAIVAKVTEFLGYDQPKPGQEAQAASPDGKPVKGVMPLPHLRVRSTQADVSAGAGDTVVLRGPLASDTQLWKDKVVGLGDLPLLGRFFRSAGTNVVRKRLYVFVTPSRVSATGEKQ